MKSQTFVSTIITPLLSLAALVLLLTACRTQRQDQPASPKSTASLTSGAQLWGQNCVRCHNLRSPGTYSDAQWDIAVHHMRVRANLTADDSRAILSFLQSGN